MELLFIGCALIVVAIALIAACFVLAMAVIPAILIFATKKVFKWISTKRQQFFTQFL